jgi:hypothetical protein
MPKKDSDTKTKSSKGKKSDKGSVGYFYGGVLKTGTAYLFSCESSDPQEVYDEKREYYGKYVTCKYVVCEDPDKILEKLKKALDKDQDIGSVYQCHASTALETLKKVSGVDRSKTLKEKPSKDDDDEKPKKKSAKKDKEDASGSDNEDASGEDASGSDDEKPAKKGKGKADTKNGKKSNDDDASDSDDEKPAKGKGKADTKKGKKSKDDDESSSDKEDAYGSDNGEGSDDEKPTKVKAKKGGKDEKKSKGKGK